MGSSKPIYRTRYNDNKNSNPKPLKELIDKRLLKKSHINNETMNSWVVHTALLEITCDRIIWDERFQPANMAHTIYPFIHILFWFSSQVKCTLWRPYSKHVLVFLFSALEAQTCIHLNTKTRSINHSFDSISIHFWRNWKKVNKCGCSVVLHRTVGCTSTSSCKWTLCIYGHLLLDLQIRSD